MGHGRMLCAALGLAWVVTAQDALFLDVDTTESCLQTGVPYALHCGTCNATEVQYCENSGACVKSCDGNTDANGQHCRPWCRDGAEKSQVVIAVATVSSIAFVIFIAMIWMYNVNDYQKKTGLVDELPPKQRFSRLLQAAFYATLCFVFQLAAIADQASLAVFAGGNHKPGRPADDIADPGFGPFKASDQVSDLYFSESPCNEVKQYARGIRGLAIIALVATFFMVVVYYFCVFEMTGLCDVAPALRPKIVRFGSLATSIIILCLGSVTAEWWERETCGCKESNQGTCFVMKHVKVEAGQIQLGYAVPIWWVSWLVFSFLSLHAFCAREGTYGYAPPASTVGKTEPVADPGNMEKV